MSTTPSLQDHRNILTAEDAGARKTPARFVARINPNADYMHSKGLKFGVPAHDLSLRQRIPETGARRASS